MCFANVQVHTVFLQESHELYPNGDMFDFFIKQFVNILIKDIHLTSNRKTK